MRSNQDCLPRLNNIPAHSDPANVQVPLGSGLVSLVSQKALSRKPDSEVGRGDQSAFDGGVKTGTVSANLSGEVTTLSTQSMHYNLSTFQASRCLLVVPASGHGCEGVSKGRRPSGAETLTP